MLGVSHLLVRGSLPSRGSVVTVTQLNESGTYLFGAPNAEIGAYLPTYPDRVWGTGCNVAAHTERPTSIWGCCGGVRDGRYYYCDSCNLYFHEGCQKNHSKGRQAPLCPSCHESALAGGGGRTRRRMRP